MSCAFYWKTNSQIRTPTGRTLKVEVPLVAWVRGGHICWREDRKAVEALLTGRLADERCIIDEYEKEYTGTEFLSFMEAYRRHGLQWEGKAESSWQP